MEEREFCLLCNCYFKSVITFFLLGDVCTCVGIRNRHRQFPWKHDNKTVGIIMSITKTLFEVTAINIISPAKNINEEGKFKNNQSKSNL